MSHILGILYQIIMVAIPVWVIVSYIRRLRTLPRLGDMYFTQLISVIVSSITSFFAVIFLLFTVPNLLQTIIDLLPSL